MNRKELQRLARERLRDARTLLLGRRWTGAYYLAGYAVECALKACIAKLMKPEEFPDKGFAEKCWTHDLERLVPLAGLKDLRVAACLADTKLAENWETAKDWKETLRYSRRTKVQALKLYAAIADAKHGVFQWIKLYW